MFEDNTVRNDKFHRPIIDRIDCSKQLSTATKIYCKLERSWGIISMLKSLQKQLQRRHKQRCLKIDTLLRSMMFSDGRFDASGANSKQYAGVIFGTPGTAYNVQYFCIKTGTEIQNIKIKQTLHKILQYKGDCSISCMHYIVYTSCRYSPT